MDAPALEKPSVGRKEGMKKILLWIAGLAVLVLGLWLILKYWSEIAVLFKALIGILIAIVGIVMMTVARDK